jgi:hypothetical protein
MSNITMTGAMPIARNSTLVDNFASAARLHMTTMPTAANQPTSSDVRTMLFDISSTFLLLDG